MANELLLEVSLQALREELEVSQVELASALGVSQPAVVAMEQRGNDIKLSTMKRYVEAMGGKATRRCRASNRKAHWMQRLTAITGPWSVSYRQIPKHHLGICELISHPEICSGCRRR